MSENNDRYDKILTNIMDGVNSIREKVSELSDRTIRQEERLNHIENYANKSVSKDELENVKERIRKLESDNSHSVNKEVLDKVERNILKSLGDINKNLDTKASKTYTKWMFIVITVLLAPIFVAFVQQIIHRITSGI